MTGTTAPGNDDCVPRHIHMDAAATAGPTVAAIAGPFRLGGAACDDCDL